jgi:Flp pilus assembly protein TadG
MRPNGLSRSKRGGGYRDLARDRHAMMKTIVRRAAAMLSRFRRSQSGNLTIAFAMALFPLGAASGVAVDYSRISSSRAALQAALDAGTLAAATESNGRTETQLRTTVENFLTGNKQAGAYRDLSFTVQATDEWTVIATARACIDLVFAGVLGGSTQCFSVTSEAKRGKNHLEVVLVLDNTGSMSSSNRIVHLRNAAKSLVEVLRNAATGDRTVKISLVPFVTSVNIKGPGFDMAWMDTLAQNPLHGVNFDAAPGSPAGTKVNHFALFNQMSLTWKGCVEARPAPFNLSDAPPTAANPSTLFVPYFAPDEPGAAAPGGNSGSAYNNSYLNDNGTTASQRTVAKYIHDPIVGRPTPIVETAPNLQSAENRTNGPNRACPTPIVPLTTNFDSLNTHIDAMRHWNGSGTNVSEGLMWGWRVLSPEAPYTDGRPFSDPTVQKVVVLLTDGENVVYGASGTPNKSDYGSYGFLASGRFGAQDQNTAARNVDGWVQQSCTGLKNLGVMVYTITLEAGTAVNKNLYQPCASRPDMYFDSPSATQLTGIFNTIAKQLVTLKLTQ